MIAAEMMPAVGLGPDREAGRFGLDKRPDQLSAGQLAIDRLRHRAVRERQPGDAVPPAVGKLDQVAIDAQCQPLRAFGRDQRVIVGVIDDIGLAILGQAFAEAVCAQNADQFGMAGIAVIAFAIVLHHQFPVGVFDIVVLHGDLETVEIVDADLIGDVGFHPVDRWRSVAHADEDQPTDILERDRSETVVRLVEILRHAARREQIAVQTIGPLVIGTHQARGAATLIETDFGTPVTAAVPERAHFLVAPAHDDDRIAGQFEHEIVARILHMRDGARIEPDRLQHHLRIEVKCRFADIELTRQGVPLAVLLEQSRNGVEARHLPSSSAPCCLDHRANPR